VQIAQPDFPAGRELFAGITGGTAGKCDKTARKDEAGCAQIIYG